MDKNVSSGDVLEGNYDDISSTTQQLILADKRVSKPSLKVQLAEVSSAAKKAENPNCKSCKKYVPSSGVWCVDCERWWHYECANTNEQKLIGMEEFQCEEHTIKTKVKVASKTLIVKLNSYSLNTKEVAKTKLKDISRPFEIDKKKDDRTLYLKTQHNHIRNNGRKPCTDWG